MRLCTQRLKSNFLIFDGGVRPVNIHEASVLNKLTERGPGWTILAIFILRFRTGSTIHRSLWGAGGIGAGAAIGAALRWMGWF